ncbi:MAG: hemolysin III family protein [Streptococcaceae bacterium]|jgi:hemolysin III|nr:hemolysin III family protein [Streptococcaceae bacterium]
MTEIIKKKPSSKAYLIISEVFNATSHGIAVGLAVLGLILLILKGQASGSLLEMISLIIYGSMLVLLFLFSTLAHSLYFSRARKVFQVFDHSGIFLLIAGTYTPYCLVSLHNWLGIILFSVIWICAILGIIFTAIFLPRTEKVPKFSTILYVIMGWMIMFAILPLYHLLSAKGFWLLVGGGVVYTIGALIYRFKFPFAHLVWHFFVLAAAILMWFSIYFFVA